MWWSLEYIQTSVWAPEDHTLSMPPDAEPSVNDQAQTKETHQGIKDALAEPDAGFKASSTT